MKILMTGFKPFLGDKVNPSEILAEKLGREFSKIESLILPVEFEKSFLLVKEKLSSEKYDYVIMLGQNAGRGKMALEKIGHNWIQTDHPDEAGVKPETGPISKNSPLALMSSFPVDEFYNELKTDMPVELSFSAGAYVCNDLYFRVLEAFPQIPSIFIHLPLIQEQVVDAAVNRGRSYYLDIEHQNRVLNKIILKLIS